MVETIVSFIAIWFLCGWITIIIEAHLKHREPYYWEMALTLIIGPARLLALIVVSLFWRSPIKYQTSPGVLVQCPITQQPIGQMTYAETRELAKKSGKVVEIACPAIQNNQ